MRATCRWSRPIRPITPIPHFHAAHDAMLCIANSTQIDAAERPRSSPRGLRQIRADDGGSFRRPARGDCQYAGHRAALRRRAAQAQADPAQPCGRQGRRGADDGGGCAREASLRGWSLMASSPRKSCKVYRDRLEFEIDVIVSMGFPGYFLIVADFIKWAKENGIPVGPGRGSGAGSLVAWALTITDLDPIRLGPAVRTLPQSRTRVDAGLRHRLLRNAARRGDPLCAEQIRPRSRRADHHLRQAEGPRGAARFAAASCR